MSTGVQHAPALQRTRLDLERLALLAGTGAWTLLVAAIFTHRVALPHGRLLVLAFPVAAAAISALWPGRIGRELRLVAAWAVLVAAAFWITPRAIANPSIALGIPAALGVAAIAGRRPAAVVIAMVIASSILGSIQAFTGIRLGPVVDLLLIALWISVIVRLATGERTERYLMPPAVLACLLYIFLTFVEILTASTPSVGFLSFRTSTWYILAFPVVAYAAWSGEVHRRIARGLVVVTLLVAGYAVLRWAIGPASAEQSLALKQSILFDGKLYAVGSFISGHQLAFWASLMAPFCLAWGIASSGRWRAAGLVGVILCVFAIFATALRGPLVGMVVGIAVVLALYLASSAFRARLGFIALLVAAVIATGIGAFAVAATSPGVSQRYERILQPSDDPAFASRERKWRQALEDIGRHPFGQGLGTAGFAQQSSPGYLRVTSLNIDSSYLKIAYEQGMVVMIFFLVAFLLLLVTLARDGIRSGDPQHASLAIAAAGTLASMLVSFYTGDYIEAAPIVAGWAIVGLGLAGLVFATAPAERSSRVRPRAETAGAE